MTVRCRRTNKDAKKTPKNASEREILLCERERGHEKTPQSTNF